ncbi:MAG: hypothetical protein K6G94_09680 [Kiritimatiellae bacterium]|nr:hypothetical protein [Kiritimatiellia bacterium]
MIEPEEIIEQHIVSLFAGYALAVPVFGALQPSSQGTEKVAPDTHISVAVDLAAQNHDWTGPNVPCDYTASIVVHVADADDPTGALFRDVCRAVRAALSTLMGDGCAALDGDGFACDAFVFDNTVTSRESLGDFSEFTKTYTATVKGRFTPQDETDSTETETEVTNG